LALAPSINCRVEVGILGASEEEHGRVRRRVRRCHQGRTALHRAWPAIVLSRHPLIVPSVCPKCSPCNETLACRPDSHLGHPLSTV
jgi:hypothetical protein